MRLPYIQVAYIRSICIQCLIYTGMVSLQSQIYRCPPGRACRSKALTLKLEYILLRLLPLVSLALELFLFLVLLILL